MEYSRRTLLSACGVGIATVLAGCQDHDPILYRVRIDPDTWIGPDPDGGGWLVDGTLEIGLNDPTDATHLEEPFVDGLTDVRLICIGEDDRTLGVDVLGDFTYEDGDVNESAETPSHIVEPSFFVQVADPPVRIVPEFEESERFCERNYRITEYRLRDPWQPGHAGRVVRPEWRGTERACEETEWAPLDDKWRGSERGP